MTIRIDPSQPGGIVSVPCDNKSTIDFIQREYPTGKMLLIESVTLNDELSQYISELQKKERAVELSRNQFSVQSYTISITGSEPRKKHTAEADYLLCAPWLCMAAFGSDITIANLETKSNQHDSHIIRILEAMNVKIERKLIGIHLHTDGLEAVRIDLSDYENLLPFACALASIANGISCISFSQKNEPSSDLFRHTYDMLTDLGCDAALTDDVLMIRGIPHIPGGIANTYGDYRLALAAAALSVASKNSILISHPQSVDQIYPTFWQEFQRCGGHLI